MSTQAHATHALLYHMHGRLSLSLRLSSYFRLLLCVPALDYHAQDRNAIGHQPQCQLLHWHNEPAGDVAGGVQATTGSSCLPRHRQHEWLGRTTDHELFTYTLDPAWLHALVTRVGVKYSRGTRLSVVVLQHPCSIP